MASGPTTTSSTSARSRAVRAIGPRVDRPGQSGGEIPPPGTRPSDGLRPVSPVAAHGMRIEPPPSDPVASGTSPPATAAAEPPDDPPGERSSAHGFRGGAEHRVHGVGLVPELGGVRLPDHHAPGGPQSLDERGVGRRGRAACERCRAAGGHVADRVLEVLHRERDARQRPGVLAGGDALVDGAGLGQRGVAVDGHERTEVGVVALDVIERQRGELASGEGAVADPAGQIRQRRAPEVHAPHGTERTRRWR